MDSDCGSPRVLRGAGLTNARDLGGLSAGMLGVTRWKAIYRSANLDHMSLESLEHLLRVRNIRAVIDLRSAEEVLPHSPVLKSSVLYRLPMLGDGRLGKEVFPAGDPVRLAELYVENVERGRLACVEALRVVASVLALGGSV